MAEIARLRHPFDRIPPGRLRLAQIPCAALALLLVGLLPLLLPGRETHTLLDLVEAQSAARASEVLARWSEADRLRLAHAVGYDYLMNPAYLNAIALACIWARRLFVSAPLAALGGLLAWLCWSAIATNVVENIGLFLALLRGPTDGWARAVAAAHYWAGLVVGACALYAAAALALRLRGRSALALAPLLALLAAPPAAAQESVVAEGRASFQRLCAACHGADGRGAGPVAPALAVPPPDLTAIRARNFGNFPYQRLREAIDGRRGIAAHGTREMPVWGHYFAVEERGGGPGAEVAAAGEITALLAWLESIQAPAEPAPKPER